MQVFKLPNAAASLVTVTGTASTIVDLISTAAGTTFVTDYKHNAIDINIEGSDNVRMLADGNEPTSTEGLLLTSGSSYRFRNIDLREIRLISTGGATTASVQIGHVEGDTSDSASINAIPVSGGPAANVNIADIGGNAASSNSGIADSGTLRVSVATDDVVQTTQGANTTVLDGTRTVATAGVAVPLTAASTAAKKVTIQADINNTGDILVGNSTSQSIVLASGDFETFTIADLNDIYIDATVNGEGVNYNGEN